MSHLELATLVVHDYDEANRRCMRYCAERWDFGMRYLDRDLPPAVYRQVRDLAFIQDLEDLKEKLAAASAWGATLLRELHPASAPR